MSIMPDGEDLRKAAKWILEEKKVDPSKKLTSLIGQACTKFDLSPKDADFMYRVWLEEQKG
ncbi:MAG: hypothetical protein HQK79_15970 [Desulfobacterales bacterium]|nr:hypothetical protein [Desulfobacterales bacterium]MBF0395994.1 hypothetical protein [Desulfobacterales bacterium]